MTIRPCKLHYIAVQIAAFIIHWCKVAQDIHETNDLELKWEQTATQRRQHNCTCILHLYRWLTSIQINGRPILFRYNHFFIIIVSLKYEHTIAIKGKTWQNKFFTLHGVKILKLFLSREPPEISGTSASPGSFNGCETILFLHQVGRMNCITAMHRQALCSAFIQMPGNQDISYWLALLNLGI